MNKDQMLRIGLAINHIAMIVDDETLKKIDSYLKQIEKTVLEEIKNDIYSTGTSNKDPKNSI